MHSGSDCSGRCEVVRVAALFISLATATAVPALGAQNRALAVNWTALHATPLGTSLEVRLRNGRTDSGFLSSVDHAGLVLNRSSSQTYHREEVLSVFSVGKKSKLPIWIGLSSGLGFSIFVNALYASCPTRGFELCLQSSERATATLLFTGIGAGVGALFYAVAKSPRTLIYLPGEDSPHDSSWVRDWHGPVTNDLRLRYFGQ